MTTANRKLFSFILTTLFALYYLNITLFPHSHKMGGLVIVHSHYYSGTSESGEPLHSHTRFRLVIISDLSLFLTTAIIFMSIIINRAPAASHRYALLIVNQPYHFTKEIFQPRAPPVRI